MRRMTLEEKEIYLRALKDVDDVIEGHRQNMDSRHDAGAIVHIESIREAIEYLKDTE